MPWPIAFWCWIRAQSSRKERLPKSSRAPWASRSAAPAGLTLEEVRQISGVLSVKADRNAFELQVNAAEPVVRELLQRDNWLADLEVTNAGLEEAFLALTKNHNAESKEN